MDLLRRMLWRISPCYRRRILRAEMIRILEELATETGRAGEEIRKELQEDLEWLFRLKADPADPAVPTHVRKAAGESPGWREALE